MQFQIDIFTGSLYHHTLHPYLLTDETEKSTQCLIAGHSDHNRVARIVTDMPQDCAMQLDTLSFLSQSE